MNATSVGVGRRNRSFLCNRNCIFDIIIIIIIIINFVFVIVVLMLQNRQVMVTSFVVVGIVEPSPHAPGLSRKNPHDINRGR